jgi:hypothetical protein
MDQWGRGVTLSNLILNYNLKYLVLANNEPPISRIALLLLQYRDGG